MYQVSTTARAVAVALCAVVVNLAGCANTGSTKTPDKISAGAQLFAEGKPQPLQPYYKALYVEGEWNAVLNFDYLGLAAMEIGEFEVAEKAFDSAIARIEAIYADDPNAEKAKSLWNAEKVKDYKGEPYERSMAHYYRGLLYLRKGDYQNARAMFLSAERHDTLSEKETFQSDFGLMNYLAAWASFCDGDPGRARELDSRAASSDPAHFEGFAYDYTYLGIIESGGSPTKAGEGNYKEQLVIKPPLVRTTVERVAFDGESLSDSGFKEAADVVFQATTRGGRPVQAILDGKVKFKDNADTVGDVALIAGYSTMYTGTYSGNDNMAGAGAIMGLFGIASKIAASATTPEADTRYWSSLPSGIYLATASNSGTPKPLRFEYTVAADDAAGAPGQGASVMEAANGRCGFSWGRTDSALAAAARVADPTALEAGRTEKNAEFRSWLEANFGLTAQATSEPPPADGAGGGAS